MAKDTKTRYQGIYARHQEGCAVERDAACNCTPSYFGSVYDRSIRRRRKTRHHRLVAEAREARRDLLEAARKGELPAPPSERITLGEARRRFIKGAREGVVLNKWRRRYRPRSVEDLEVSLNQIPEEMARRRFDNVTRAEVQAQVDRLTPRVSSSRVGSFVNSMRALYRWGQERELTAHDPAQHVRLPLSDSEARDRVATPAEFDRLIKALWRQTPEEIEEGVERDGGAALKEAIPYALAAYATARKQEIEVLGWRDLRLDLAAGELAADPDGRKPGGSWRIVFLVEPLLTLLREEWIAQGRPAEGKVCPPERVRKSGRKSMRTLQERVRKRWEALDLDPIGLQECRHTAATWLDHAGVTPKVASQIMGHKTPEYQPGAARITLERYTHMLPGELEHAREEMERFLEVRLREERELERE
jgi:integrase